MKEEVLREIESRILVMTPDLQKLLDGVRHLRGYLNTDGPEGKPWCSWCLDWSAYDHQHVDQKERDRRLVEHQHEVLTRKALTQKSFQELRQRINELEADVVSRRGADPAHRIRELEECLRLVAERDWVPGVGLRMTYDEYVQLKSILHRQVTP